MVKEPKKILCKEILIYFLALPEIDFVDILKTFVLSLNLSMYFNPSETKSSEYLCTICSKAICFSSANASCAIP
jgi:hypothetical protein